MIQIDKELIDALFEQAKGSARMRQNYDMRTSSEDSSQRMLNALMPGTEVAIHRHPHSSENVICICGRLDEILYDADGNETERIMLCPVENKFGCIIPANTWHTVEVYEPSVIYEAKDGRYGEDGSESWEDYKKEILAQNQKNSFDKLTTGNLTENKMDDIFEGSSQAPQNPKDNPENNPNTISSFNNSLGDLKKNIEYLIGMERQSGSMDVITPLYVSRMLNVPLEEVEKAMKEMDL